MPFKAKTADDLKAKIKKGNLKFIDRDWKKKSNEIIDLIKQCLNPNPNKRPTASELLNHKWFTIMSKKENDKSAIRKVLVKDMTERLHHFQMMNYLQKSFLKFIFENITNDELSQKLKLKFQEADYENTGVIEAYRLKEIYKQSTEELQKSNHPEKQEEIQAPVEEQK